MARVQCAFIERDRTLPYLPLQLSYRRQTIQTEGMIDTGSMVNVLPYHLGTQLGQRWDDFNIELERRRQFTEC